jgi:hypothetical protein
MDGKQRGRTEGECELLSRKKWTWGTQVTVVTGGLYRCRHGQGKWGAPWGSTTWQQERRESRPTTAAVVADSDAGVEEGRGQGRSGGD